MDTKQTLAAMADNLDESLGERKQDAKPSLAPIARERDVGRSPIRNIGRLDISQIIPDPDQPRTDISEEALHRLTQSIRDKGQLNPIRVRWSDTARKWIIVAGERRWRAAQQAGLSTIECYFHDTPLSESEILEEQLIENCLREDLRPLEEARAFGKLMSLNDWNAKQLAEAIRVNPSKVSRTLSLLKLPAAIRKQVDAGQISARSAYEISKITDKTVQQRLAAMACAEELTHRQIADVVRQRRGKRKSSRCAIKQSFFADNGWRVVVTSSKGGAYHHIEQALVQVLAEVRHRINNNVDLG